ncbi:hypothetical protein DPMN_001696 [Dreissena polymorpha]|uniref:Uncharacterized protein n=1 Tax=Dreissena polymorpha TaxID=45954 RepID=A0A9D4MIV3_DREPO|nr:hypothetical protein DPMN_001692 [Dreissena polymorpha]KAH3877818.1 hypothetical protein DPMN_001696 [Dreissena polymorpha]
MNALTKYSALCTNYQSPNRSGGRRWRTGLLGRELSCLDGERENLVLGLDSWEKGEPTGLCTGVEYDLLLHTGCLD